MTRRTLILALAITAAACSSPDLEAELRSACHGLLDSMSLAGPGSCLQEGDERALRAQCDVGPVVINECSEDLLAYYDCLIDAVWVCKPEHPGAPLPADPFACADENAQLARCYREQS